MTICLIGAFDTKGTEYAFVRDRIRERGHGVLTVNTGVLGSTDLFGVDVEADEVARAGGTELARLRERRDRGEAMRVMTAGAPAVVAELHERGRIDAVLGMGGTGGTTVVTAAMRALPLSVPTVCVSTAAAGDVGPYLGTRGITMIPSIVDVAGINRISRIVLTRASAAVCAMAEASPPADEADRPVIAASMFGNTTECVDACRERLTAHGYEVLVFHATGTGGRTMESLVRDGLVDAVLDITTTEWADTVCGGVFDAGPERLDAPGQMGLPHLIVPGCVDMANFGAMDTVPERYRQAGRTFYEWNPSVTLMRTDAEENRRMGEVFARKANAAAGPVAFLVPLRGVSILDGDGQPFCDRAADAAFLQAVKAGLRDDIVVEELDANINDAAFADRAVAMMLDLAARGRG